MAQMAFFFDGTRCTGCKTCVYACKDKNNLDVGIAYRKVYEYTGGETTANSDGTFTTTCFSYPVSVSCNHCDAPVCMENCPTGSIFKSEDTGLMSVNGDTCIACGTCVSVCPYHAPVINEELNHAVRCDGCANLVDAGELPACVMACPARALWFGDVSEIQERGDQADIAPLPDPSETSPNLYIKASADAKKFDSDEGEIANPLEVDMA